MFLELNCLKTFSLSQKRLCLMNLSEMLYVHTIWVIQEHAYRVRFWSTPQESIPFTFNMTVQSCEGCSPTSWLPPFLPQVLPLLIPWFKGTYSVEGITMVKPNVSLNTFYREDTLKQLLLLTLFLFCFFTQNSPSLKY
jgi:hypothetical protein